MIGLGAYLRIGAVVAVLAVVGLAVAHYLIVRAERDAAQAQARVWEESATRWQSAANTLAAARAEAERQARAALEAMRALQADSEATGRELARARRSLREQAREWAEQPLPPSVAAWAAATSARRSAAPTGKLD